MNDTLRKWIVATAFSTAAWGYGGYGPFPDAESVATAGVKGGAAEDETPPSGPSEEETIRKWVKTLKRTQTPLEMSLPPLTRKRTARRPSSPARLRKSFKKAFNGMEVLAELDKRKVGEALREALDDDEGRYFLLLAMGQVGGERNLDTLRQVASIWSEEPTRDPDDVEAQAAAALLYRNGIREPFERVLRSYDRAAGEEMFVGEDESLHFYIRGKLNALAGRRKEALADLAKVRQLRVMGGSLKQAVRTEPDLHDLWEDPELADIVKGWTGAARPRPPRPDGGYLGLQPAPVPKEDREWYGMKPNEKGILIAAVMEDTPAEKAGLQEEDVILAINGESARDPAELTEKVSSCDAGDEVTLSILRNKERLEIKVVLGQRPDPRQQREEKE